jgi:alkanesulfonate monooxygenase SsuD/methylene tetrahydromethanopterin reductase-like flavin-dependent oxidoreductase (luciferase family)
MIPDIQPTGSGHQSPGLWRHPDDKSTEFNKIQHWVKLAQLLEKGKFHGIFIADVLVSVSWWLDVKSQNHILIRLLYYTGRIRRLQGSQKP